MNQKKTNQLKIFLFAIVLIFIVGPMLVRNFIPILLMLAIGFGIWYFLNKGKMTAARDFIDADQFNQTMNNVFSGLPKVVGGIIFVVFLIILLAKSIIIIPAGKTGVYHLFGRVSDKELSSGLHLVNPLAKITKMSIRTEEYTMSVAYGEGRHTQADAIRSLTKEGLTVDLDITVFYHLLEQKASDVFKELDVNYEEKIIRPEIRSAIREVIAQYEAKAIYSEKRQEAAIKILETLKTNTIPRGIEIEQVLLRNVNLPPKLAESIQEKLTAEQEAERMNFVLDKEKKEADRKRIEAAGQRDSQTIVNESLTEKYLEYLYINSLKDREGTVYVPVNPDNGLPLFKNLP